MALKRHLWYTDLVLATFERSGNQLIGFVMANYAYQQNYKSLGQPHGLEEAPAVHRPGPSHFIEKKFARGRAHYGPLQSLKV